MGDAHRHTIRITFPAENPGQFMPVPYREQHFGIDQVVPCCFGSCKLIVQIREEGPVFILPWVLI